MNTKMKNSRVSDEWLARAVAENPIAAVVGPNGPTGNYTTCPVRLSWTDHLITPRPPKNNGKPTYDCAILFPPGVDMSLLQNAALALINANATKLMAGGKYVGEPIFHDQGMKASYEGYTPGGIYLNVSSQYKPQIVEPSRTGAKGVFNPITSDERVYPGVWAIAAINPYCYGVSPPQPKKGVKFGIQSICLLQDDQRLGGGAIDPREAFGGINITSDTNVGGMFAQQMGGQPIASMAQPQHAMGAAMPAAGGMTAEQMREMGLV